MSSPTSPQSNSYSVNINQGTPDHSDHEDESIYDEKTPLQQIGETVGRYESINYQNYGISSDMWSVFRTRIKYYVPCLSWMPKYDIKDLPHDVIAGTTVAFLLVPQGLSYASALAKLEPVYGLFTAFVPVITYSLLGTSRQLSIGPEALISILVGAAISKQQLLSNEDVPTDPAVIASTLCLLVGLFTFLLGIFRFGFLDSVLSRALLRGFISAVAFVIMIEQLPALLGITKYLVTPLPDGSEPPLEEPTEESPIEKLFRIISKIHYTHPLTSCISLGSITFLVGMSKLKAKFSHTQYARYIPEILLSVVLATFLSYVLDWEECGVVVLGPVKSKGFPPPVVPSIIPFARVKSLTISAVLISVIGFVESIVITKQYASKHNYAVSRNRELVALGVANVMGSFFHAYPSYGSLARSRVNDKVGARTQLAGFISGMLILITILFLLPLFYHLPKAVMASIITVAAFSLVELHDVAFILKIHAWKDIMLLLFTFIMTIGISIEAGTLLSISLSLLLVVKHTTLPRITILGRLRGTQDKFKSIKEFPLETEHLPGTLLIKIEEPLHFANTGELRERLQRIERFGDMSVHPSEETRLGRVEHVVFDIESMPWIDASAIQILLELVTNYHTRGITVSFVRMRASIRKKFTRSGLVDVVGPERFFRKLGDAIAGVNGTGSGNGVSNDRGGSDGGDGEQDDDGIRKGRSAESVLKAERGGVRSEIGDAE